MVGVPKLKHEHFSIDKVFAMTINMIQSLYKKDDLLQTFTHTVGRKRYVNLLKFHDFLHKFVIKCGLIFI